MAAEIFQRSFPSLSCRLVDQEIVEFLSTKLARYLRLDGSVNLDSLSENS